MPKVLGQAGISLADVYDVEGSEAGVEQLLSKDVNLVHEMGSTIFSERMIGALEQGDSGAIAASAGFDVAIPTGILSPGRVLGLVVTADTISRLDKVQVSIRNSAGIDFPIFAWNVAVDEQVVIRMSLDGGSATNEILMRPLRPLVGNVPSMIFGAGQPETMDGFIMRGLASAFGAGTVTITATIYVAFPAKGALSSQGLPVPSW